MRKLTILAMVLALAAVAMPAIAETGCPGAEAPFVTEAPALATPAAQAPAPEAGDPAAASLPEGQEPLLLGGTCEEQCQAGYRQCLVTCSKNPCLISCEDQRCYCLQSCGSGCGLES